MSPNLSGPGLVRSAAVVNLAIRAVVRGARDRAWTQAERALYEQLRDEWVAATLRDEVVEAA